MGELAKEEGRGLLYEVDGDVSKAAAAAKRMSFL